MLYGLSLVIDVVQYPLLKSGCTECIMLPLPAGGHVMERSPVSRLESVSIRNISPDIHGPPKTPKNLKVPLTQWDYKQISSEILSNHEQS